MNSVAFSQNYRQTILQLRLTMAQERKWSGMPALLDELHRLRSLATQAQPPAKDIRARSSAEFV